MKRVAIFLFLVASLAACSAPTATAQPTENTPAATEQATQAPEATAAPTEAAKPSGKITLCGWSYDIMVTPGLVDEFNKEYPDVEVEVVTYDSSTTYQNIQLACSSGEGAPDVVQLENSHLAQYVHTDGCLADITDHVTPLLDKFNNYKWIDA